ncbi:PIG-L family deacetylase [Akkermansiaceae bacterium]|nr:PIG-L family deacetylase [Akkermansiaceae bacterium]
MKKVLILAAHPDDDVLGCGGLMAKYSEVVEFRVVFIGEGSSCRFVKEKIGTKEVIDTIHQRNNFGVEALKILGVDDIVFYDLPCGRLDQHPILEINKIIEKEIRNFKPDTVFTHSEKDANNDHVVVNKSTMMATRPGAVSGVKRVYTYEILSSSEWKFTDVFDPNYFESLTHEQVKLKCKSLAAYESEIKDYPYPRSEEGIVVLAKYRGMQANLPYAEAYKLIRSIHE